MKRFGTPLAAAALAALAALAPEARAQCAPGNASAQLNASDVRATVYNTGQLFYRTSDVSSQYVVPASGTAVPVFAAGLWMGGTVGGQLRVAGTNYGTSADGSTTGLFEYAPGPLDAGGLPPNTTNCTAYDRIYRVSDADVTTYEGGGAATADLAAWPIGLGAPAVDSNGDPITSTDRTRVINLAAGERPVVPGSQVAFWVMNDYTTHPSTGTPALGVEVQAMAFVLDSTAVVFDQSTYYRFTVVNRSNQTIDNFRIGLFVDGDLGCYTDDYVASDVGRGMIYTYNSDNADTTCEGVVGYGANPPAFGVDLLQGTPSALMYFVNEAGIPTNDPDDGQGYYNILQGLWKDGTPMTEGAFGYLSAGAQTRYAFASGNPVTPSFWSERCNNATGACTANTPGDRRMIASALNGTLEPGEAGRFDLALIFARGTTNNLGSIAALQAGSDAIQAAYDAGTLFPDSDVTPVVVEEGPNGATFGLVAAPNPTSGAATVSYALPAASDVRLVAYDALGRVVAVLADGAQAAGAHTATLETAGLQAGPYLVVLEAASGRATTRVTVR